MKDAEVSYRWRNDPEIWTLTGRRPDRYITLEIESEWIRTVIAEPDSKRFAIEVNGKYVGNIQITNIRDQSEGQYHIFIGEKQFWGKGVATLATWQVIRYAKEVLKLKQLFLFVNPLHNSAIHIYEKCGFEKVSDEIKMILDLDRSHNPTVSVQMITYNHEKHIKRAIASILLQRTNFDFEIVIGDDCSTDHTRSIIENIAVRYPGKFKLILHKSNVGAVRNQQYVSRASTGRYIAICEGDDYWADSDKLQQQVDYLEAHPDYGMVYGHSYLLTNEGRLVSQKAREIKNLETLLMNNPLRTATICVRKMLYDRFRTETKEHTDEWLMGDYPMYLWLFVTSRISLIDTAFAVYNKHNQGSATDFPDFEKGRKFVSSVIRIKRYFYSFYNGDIPFRYFVKREYSSLFRLSLQHRRYLTSCRYFFREPIENLKFIRDQLSKSDSVS